MKRLNRFNSIKRRVPRATNSITMGCVVLAGVLLSVAGTGTAEGTLFEEDFASGLGAWTILGSPTPANETIGGETPLKFREHLNQS